MTPPGWIHTRGGLAGWRAPRTARANGTGQHSRGGSASAWWPPVPRCSGLHTVSGRGL